MLPPASASASASASKYAFEKATASSATAASSGEEASEKARHLFRTIHHTFDHFFRNFGFEHFFEDLLHHWWYKSVQDLLANTKTHFFSSSPGHLWHHIFHCLFHHFPRIVHQTSWVNPCKTTSHTHDWWSPNQQLTHSSWTTRDHALKQQPCFSAFFFQVAGDQVLEGAFDYSASASDHA